MCRHRLLYPRTTVTVGVECHFHWSSNRLYHRRDLILPSILWKQNWKDVSVIPSAGKNNRIELEQNIGSIIITKRSCQRVLLLLLEDEMLSGVEGCFIQYHDQMINILSLLIIFHSVSLKNTFFFHPRFCIILSVSRCCCFSLCKDMLMILSHSSSPFHQWSLWFYCIKKNMIFWMQEKRRRDG